MLRMSQTWQPAATSPQSGRQNLAQGEASAASETLGQVPNNNRVRFSGRKNLSTAKAGSRNKCDSQPRAALRFTSFRFACPGLNSFAGYAGLLSASTYRHFYYVMILASIVCFGFGCNRGNGINSRTGGGGFPGSSTTPAQVSSSSEVVKVSVNAVQSAPGSSTDAIVKLAITPGYHVNANPATYPYLIATEVKPGNSEGITAGAPAYPAATKQKFEFAEEPLAVYEGNIEIKLPLKISATSAGERTLPTTVRIQACDTEKCFPPATINTRIPVEVK
jgi:Thiol:disulfide interchange protein DsbD, N-terminal